MTTTQWVLRHPPYSGATFVVHLALAAVADADGDTFEVTVDLDRVGRADVVWAIRRLVDDGLATLLYHNRSGGGVPA